MASALAAKTDTERESELLESVRTLCETAADDVSVDDAMTQINQFGIEPLCAILEEGLDKVPEGRALLSRTAYMALYTLGIKAKDSKPEDVHLLRERYKTSIEMYLATSVKPALERQRGNDLLTAFCTRWSNQRVFVEWMRRLFRYLDFDSQVFGKTAEDGSTPTLTSSGLLLFKTVVFDHNKGHIVETIQAMVNRDREGELVERDIIKKAVEMFLVMGIAEDKTDFKSDKAVGDAALNISTGRNTTYVEDFEKPFLRNTGEFYQRKASEWIASDSTPEFLKKADAAIKSEDRRVDNYLNPATRTGLLQLCRETLLAAHMEELMTKEGSGVKSLLQTVIGPSAGGGGGDESSGGRGRIADLRLMYSLFVHVDNGVKRMAELFKEHVIEVGNTIIRKRDAKGAALIAKTPEGKKPKSMPSYDPDYVQELITMWRTFHQCVNDDFDCSTEFQKAFKAAMEEVLNQEAAGHTHPELVATFMDYLLKGRCGKDNIRDERQLTNIINDTLELFRYFTDKDIFGTFYRAQLAKRLLSKKSFSDDLEKFTISQLKVMCSPQFTFKLEGMIKDYDLARDADKLYDDHNERNPEQAPPVPDFSCHVLKTGHWPSFSRFPEVTLPESMTVCKEHFTKYYMMQPANSNRTLNWVFGQGSATLRTTFDRGGWRDIDVATIQAIVLLQFNRQRTFTVSGLAATCNLDMKNFKNIIGGMVQNPKAKVLTNTTSKKGIKDDDVLAFNYGFYTPSKKVTVPPPALTERKESVVPDDERRLTLDAAIVRVMKARKTLSHTNLVQEVLQQIRFFRPDPKFIKRRINSLIEESYLRREDPSKHNSPYVYVAGEDGI